jgi:hypothetical protein
MGWDETRWIACIELIRVGVVMIYNDKIQRAMDVIELVSRLLVLVGRRGE